MSTHRDRLALAAVVAAVLLAQVLLYPGIGGLVQALGATTELDAGMWFLAAEFGAFVTFVGVWGALSDAAGKRVPFIAVGALGGAAGYGVLGVLPAITDVSFGVVLALRVVQGAATIGAFSLAMTMLMDLDGGHGKNMGAAGIAIGSGTAVGAPLGGQLSEVDALAPLYLACALLVVAGVLVWFVEDRAPSGGRSARAALASIRATPTLSIPYAFGLIDRMTAGFFALVGTLYFQDAFGIGPGETGLVLMLFFAPFALLQYPMGALSDRIGRTLPIVAGSALYGLGVISVGLAPTLRLAGVGMVAVGVLGALVSPATMALVTDIARDGDRGVAMGGFNMFGSVGFLLGFLVGGTVADAYGYLTAFFVAGGMEILIALVTIPAFLRLDIGGVPTLGERASEAD
ncbi:MFS transporter [Natronoarchaeum philippinense]|uniref:MFS transporter n=1 Tax=Natronoarchaeum philippinense TaxID=558529 RepID=UPI000BE383EB|nr:MFS transporter [Natronoarchaeum philippinense]